MEQSVNLLGEKVLPTKKARQSATLTIENQSIPKMEEVIPCRSSGSLQKLVCVTAYVLRCISNLKRSLDGLRRFRS